MALSLLVWAFYIGLSHLPGDSGFLFGFFVVVLVIIPLGWIEAELNFGSAARHD